MDRTFVTCVLALSSWVAVPQVAHADDLRTIVRFDPALGELPESIAADHCGNLYVSVAQSVRKVDAQRQVTTIATLPLPAGANSNGLKVGPDGWIYIVSNSFSPVPSAAFVWRVSPTGAVEQFAALDPNGFPNDLAFDDDDNMYVTDSFLGLIWKIDPHRVVSVWASDPLLFGNPAAPVVPIHDLGANGIAFDRKERNIYISNTDYGKILRVSFDRGHHAGPVQVFVDDPLLRGIDGVAFDTKENLYVAVNFQDRIASIDKQGHVHVVAEGSPLDGPASLVFGTGRRDDDTLYISNFAIFRALGVIPGVPSPSIGSLSVPHPGLELP
jgi:sugar lactone lactonase YvrE